MPYIGTSPSNGVRRVHTYTATASQTTFTGASSEGVTLSYVDTNYIDVFQNGVLLGSADYTSTSGTSVVLAQGASADDLVVIVVYDVFSVADTVSKTNGGSFDSAVTMSNNLTVSGAFTSQGIDDNADATAITIDSSENVGIGTTSPSFESGTGGGLEINNSSGNGSHLKLTDSASGSGGTNGFDLYAFNTSGYVENYESGNIVFRNNGTERMRIDSSGNVMIGTTTVDLSAVTSGTGTTVTGTGQLLLAHDGNNMAYMNLTNYDGGTENFFVFMSDASTKGSIGFNGSSTSYNTSSDHRLKESVTYDFDATTRLKQLKPCRFNFIDNADTTVDGFLAHEVQSVVPEAITGTHNEEDDDGNPVYQQIDQSKLVPLLVKTIQELEARITALENAE